ncbi:hypothetical protein AB9F46_33895 [Rhizobium leguminosarum]|uniref:hypothetical protein n=1 Tax=Rhizobium leguminosarum TaxID=384 RepID=UPI003F97FC72
MMVAFAPPFLRQTHSPSVLFFFFLSRHALERLAVSFPAFDTVLYDPAVLGFLELDLVMVAGSHRRIELPSQTARRGIAHDLAFITAVPA